MDLKTVVIISSLLLVPPAMNQTTLDRNTHRNTVSTPTNSIRKDYSVPPVPRADTAVPTSNSSKSATVLHLLTVKWTSTCEGNVLISYFPPNRKEESLPVCHNQEANVQIILKNVCQNKKGCEDVPSWHKNDEGFNTEKGAKKKSSCKTLRVKCKVEVLSDVRGQLLAYKLVTALLCCMLLILLLSRFTRPTIKALQKRLSHRRQNRWIGPTQSHSVSYHRGKTAVKNSDEEKRLSYPGLERLAISREPSSNRNSDCNF